MPWVVSPLRVNRIIFGPLARCLVIPDSGEIADISQPSLRAIPDSCIAANRLYSVGAGLFGQTRFAKSLNQQLRV
jgi:hypothetical protein